MRKSSQQKGFIKILVIVAVGICIVFVIVAALAKYVAPGVSGTGRRVNTLTGGEGGSIEVRTNPLLDFGDSTNYGNYGTYGTDSRVAPDNSGKASSAYTGKVTLSTGNASYSSQPFQEYVTLRNYGPDVNITGWKLQNGKGNRPIQNSQNSYFYPTPDTVTIGYGTEFLDPSRSGNFQNGPIVLKNGDTAIVTTGGPYAQYSYSINTSFRENKCLGYLDTYPFEPSVQKNCPYVSDDPQVKAVTDECYDYIRSLNRCEDPQRVDKERYDEQPSHCKNFLVTRTNYPGCVAFHRNEKDFASNQWRIFLRHKTELWAESRETITLYDAGGNIVDQVSY